MESSGVDYLTAAEAAAVMRVTPWSVTEKCRSGEIRASKPGKSWLIAAADLQAYLDKHANRPADEGEVEVA